MSTAARDEVREAGNKEVRQIYDPVADTPARYRRDPVGAHPPLDYPPYKSTQLRHPRQPLIYLPHTVTETPGPHLSAAVDLKPTDSDLTVQARGEPIGERIIVSGHVYDTEG